MGHQSSAVPGSAA